jgi:hypothetical protein
VEVRAGQAVRKHKLVKSTRPDDLVFQSVQDGKPMRDGNILQRFIKPRLIAKSKNCDLSALYEFHLGSVPPTALTRL